MVVALLGSCAWLDPCPVRASATAPSPDVKREAIFVARVCGVLGDDHVAVSVVPKGVGPLRRGNVLNGRSGACPLPEEAVRLRWSSANALEVTHQACVSPVSTVAAIGDVTISFVPVPVPY